MALRFEIGEVPSRRPKVEHLNRVSEMVDKISEKVTADEKRSTDQWSLQSGFGKTGNIQAPSQSLLENGHFQGPELVTFGRAVAEARAGPS